jgi:hypothetical protein
MSSSQERGLCDDEDDNKIEVMGLVTMATHQTYLQDHEPNDGRGVSGSSSVREEVLGRWS